MVEIFIRLYAECSEPKLSRSIANAITSSLQNHDPEFINPPYKYWKIPEFFGFEIKLKKSSEEIYKSLIALSQGKWEHSGDYYDRSSTWNWTGSDYFLVPQARWAEVQLTIRD